jgi:hypothetical protein
MTEPSVGTIRTEYTVRPLAVVLARMNPPPPAGSRTVVAMLKSVVLTGATNTGWTYPEAELFWQYSVEIKWTTSR